MTTSMTSDPSSPEHDRSVQERRTESGRFLQVAGTGDTTGVGNGGAAASPLPTPTHDQTGSRAGPVGPLPPARETGVAPPMGATPGALVAGGLTFGVTPEIEATTDRLGPGGSVDDEQGGGSQDALEPTG